MLQFFRYYFLWFLYYAKVLRPDYKSMYRTAAGPFEYAQQTILQVRWCEEAAKRIQELKHLSKQAEYDYVQKTSKLVLSDPTYNPPKTYKDSISHYYSTEFIRSREFYFTKGFLLNPSRLKLFKTK